MATMGIHGEGTRTELPNGRWRVAVTMAGGRRVWRRARSEREAKRLQRELVEARELDLDPTRQTLGAYLHSWIERQRSGRRIRPATILGYERIVTLHIEPELGKVPLARLSRRKVQAWVDSIHASPQTVRNCHAVLRKALASATGDVIPLNPAIGVELPKRETFHGNPLTASEAKRLLEVTRTDRLGAFWRLAIVSGLREGELLGLPRDALRMEDSDEATMRRSGTGTGDVPAGTGPRGLPQVELPRMAERRRVDGEVGGDRPSPHARADAGPLAQGDGVRAGRSATLTVTSQLQRIGGRWVLGPTKAGRSLNRIALDPETARIVRAHLAKMAEERQPSWRYFGLMFPTETGEPYHAATILRAFRAVCEAAGISRRRVHDLRATSATLLRDLGVAEDTRMSRLGHSTTQMARHYGQASIEQDREAVERLAEVIG